MPMVLTDTELQIGGWQVMQSWERPLMDIMAREVTASKGDILEVGFGMGISARAIVDQGCRTYTVIEAHPGVAALAREWTSHLDIPANVIEGLWQDVIPQLSLSTQFDGILFDTYPLSEAERSRNHVPFVPWAPLLLRNEGVFVYYSDETEEFRAEHLKLLLSNFDEVKLIKVSGLEFPPDCEYWDSSHMIVPVARKTATV